MISDCHNPGNAFTTGKLSFAAWRVILVCSLFFNALQIVEAQPVGRQGFYSVRPYNGDAAQVVLLTNRAVLLSRSGRNEEAVQLLQQALALDPHAISAHINMSVALIALKRFEEAMHECEIVMQEDDHQEKAYLNYTSAAIMANRLPEAVKVGRAYLKKFPNGAARKDIETEVEQAKNHIRESASRGGLSGPPGVGDYYLFLVTPQGRQRWDYSKMPLKVFLYRGQDCRGFLPIFNLVLTDAFKDWQKASGVVSFIPANSPSEADIECKWTDDQQALKSMGEGGETRTAYRKIDGAITHATITILTYFNGKPVSPNLVWATSLHEIGHALGLDGHSDNSQDILYAWASFNVEHAQLSQRDVNTLRLLYQ
jgi:tetratricopeptide (TPR) repeat protein